MDNRYEFCCCSDSVALPLGQRKRDPRRKDRRAPEPIKNGLRIIIDRCACPLEQLHCYQYKMSSSYGSQARSRLLPSTLSRGYDSSDDEQTFAASQSLALSQTTRKRKISLESSHFQQSESMEWLEESATGTLTESLADHTLSDIAPSASQSSKSPADQSLSQNAPPGSQSLQTASDSQAAPPDIQGTADSGVLTTSDEARVVLEEQERRRKRSAQRLWVLPTLTMLAGVRRSTFSNGSPLICSDSSSIPLALPKTVDVKQTI